MKAWTGENRQDVPAGLMLFALNKKWEKSDCGHLSAASGQAVSAASHPGGARPGQGGRHRAGPAGPACAQTPAAGGRLTGKKPRTSAPQSSSLPPSAPSLPPYPPPGHPRDQRAPRGEDLGEGPRGVCFCLTETGDRTEVHPCLAI